MQEGGAEDLSEAVLKEPTSQKCPPTQAHRPAQFQPVVWEQTFDQLLSNYQNYANPAG